MDKKIIKPFIVLSHQRAGTTTFCNEILPAHKQVYCFDELFNQPNSRHTNEALDKNQIKRFNSLKYKIEGKLFGSEFRYRNYHKDFLNKIYKSKQKEVIGFKLFTQHLPASIFKSMLLDTNNKIIVLERRNYIQAAVSIYLLTHFGQRNSIDKQELLPFEVDIDWCALWIAKNRYNINRAKKLLEKNGKEYFFVPYEELFDLSTINKVFNFLGLSPLKEFPDLKLKKLSGSKTYNKILNIKELEAALCNDYNGYLRE